MKSFLFAHPNERVMFPDCSIRRPRQRNGSSPVEPLNVATSAFV